MSQITLSPLMIGMLVIAFCCLMSSIGGCLFYVLAYKIPTATTTTSSLTTNIQPLTHAVSITVPVTTPGATPTTLTLTPNPDGTFIIASQALYKGQLTTIFMHSLPAIGSPPVNTGSGALGLVSTSISGNNILVTCVGTSGVGANPTQLFEFQLS